MARKELKTKPLTDVQGGIAKSIMSGVADLYSEHVDRIDKLLRESDGQKATVRFSVEIDCTASAPIVDVGIRFTDTITDHRKYSLEDPAQPSLFGEDDPDGDRPNDNVDEDQAPKKRGRRGKEAASEGQGDPEGSEA